MSNGGSSKILASRRGMSPLIATVLLMAFAVALGGMIMNWSFDKNASGDCDLIKVQVTKFCASDNMIQVSLRNGADSVPLRGIQLNIVDSNFEPGKIKNSDLTAGQPFDTTVAALLTPGSKVQLIGMVGPENNPTTCTQPMYEANPIKAC